MYLHSFRFADGGTIVPQQRTIEWLAAQYATHSGMTSESALKRISRFACASSRISQRRTFLPEWSHGTSPEALPDRNLEQRMSVYQDEMGNALQSVLSHETLTSSPTFLLHVTCTGYAAPSIAQQWVSKRIEEFPSLPTPIVQHLYHMGCYASVPALRTAQGLLAVETDASVAIVHTEFCSLHLHAVTTSPEQWVVQSLFADAVVKYEATATPPKGQRSLRLLTTFERICPASIGDMTWNLTDKRFEMTLSRDVPTKIRDCLRPFVKDLLARAGLSVSDLPQMIAAIHPGGPRIIDQVMQSLELDESQVKWSRKTLYENGNVSSATLPLLWKSLIDASEIPLHSRIFCLAFGPGLTLAGAVLEMTEATP
jgi:predicted naringenin-chalcone synthase